MVSHQAEFSFSYWPFSMKLLWAPIVDSLYIKSFGRRKTWLVPVQYLIGITMLVLAASVQKHLGIRATNHFHYVVLDVPKHIFFLSSYKIRFCVFRRRWIRKSTKCVYSNMVRSTG